MSFRTSTWRSTVRNSVDDISTQSLPSTTALNFFLALGSSGLPVWRPNALKADTPRPQWAGQGGFAMVEIGETPDKRPIVVKRSLKLDSPQLLHQPGVFARHFDQLCLELRILSHRSIREHRNIVDLLGLCVDSHSGDPSVALVLEYAAFGSLDGFLSDGEIADHEELMRCAVQVSHGLGALHKLNICHGDVKAKNVLVFSEDGKWLYKVADFGHSVVSTTSRSIEEMRIPQGTLLYNAPEIRGAFFRGQSTFTIADALMTDVFSFGLLVWEILNKGKPYYTDIRAYAGDHSSEREDATDFLLRLPFNELYSRALRCVEERQFPPAIKHIFTLTLEESLQESPCSRASMESIGELLEEYDSLAPARRVVHPDSEREILPEWTSGFSLYEVIKLYRRHRIFLELDKEPLRTIAQNRVYSELRVIADSNHVPQHVRADAALAMCECLSIGYGAGHDNDQTLFLLRQAALYGSHKASRWLPRIQLSFRNETLADNQEYPEALSERLSTMISSTSYLSSRIRQRGFTKWTFKPLSDYASPTSHLKLLDSVSIESIYANPNCETTQQMLSAALAGDDAFLTRLLQDSPPEGVSTSGFDAVHLACVSGQLSTLKMLVKAGFSASRVACYGLTALHLCIFFAQSDAPSATEVLLKHGADPALQSRCNTIWEDHDLQLSGTPLDWAIQARNLDLVKALVPVTPALDNGIRACNAGSMYFWEILDAILTGSAEEKSLSQQGIIVRELERPIHHWIAHGSDRFIAIDRTLQVNQKHGLPLVFDTRSGPTEHMTTNLMTLIAFAAAEEDFYLIERLINLATSAQIKKICDRGDSALIKTIFRATNNDLWTRLLQALVQHYTIAELEAETLDTISYLHIAVIADSVVGARVLLQKGVNVNQPTFHPSQDTPIHLCIGGVGSVEMCKLLVDYGADMTIKEKRTMSSPLVRLARRPRLRSSKLIDYILEVDFPDSTYLELLHITAHLFWNKIMDAREPRELFRHLLTIPKVARLVNDVNSDGVTLLQACAYSCSLEATELLLEAGADVGIGVRHNGWLGWFGSKVIYPLQIACLRGKAELENVDERDFKTREAEAEKLIRLCSRLLERHHALGDGLFTGITLLHVAAYVGLKARIRQLQGEAGAVDRKGRWPGLQGEFTPSELAKKAWKKDLIVLYRLNSKLGKKRLDPASILSKSRKG